MTVSTIPAVVDALVAAARAALPGVQVLDGGPVTDLQPDVVCVGHTGEPGEASIDARQTDSDYGGATSRETYQITCLASSWRGDTTAAKTVRDRAFEMVAALAAGLDADQTLGGVAARVDIATHLVGADQTDKGPVCTVRFAVTVDAFRG